MKLLLFDIDGTLLRVSTSGRVAVRHAIERTFGRPLEVDGISFSGKTDPQILSEILEFHGYTISPGDKRFDRVLELYAEDMLERLDSEDVEVLPGVRTLITRLSERDNIRLGLLTGNLEETAYRKLSAAALDQYFPFGAFGSDHHDRHQLPAIALDRARAKTGHHFRGSDVVIIGDTPHDVTCGQSIGASAVGVCTGRISREELAEAEPDILLDDLDCCDRFIETLERLSIS